MAAQYVIMEQVEAQTKRRRSAVEENWKTEVQRLEHKNYSEHTLKHFTKADNGGRTVKYLVICTCIVVLLLDIVGN